MGQQAPAVADQHAQQVELDRREVDLLAAAADHPRGEVDSQPVRFDDRLTGLGVRRGAAPPAGARPARAG